MKAPRPDRSRPSSTRLTGCPIQLVAVDDNPTVAASLTRSSSMPPDLSRSAVRASSDRRPDPAPALGYTRATSPSRRADMASMKLAALALGLAINLSLPASVVADCLQDRSGEVICGGGPCLRDVNGEV